jgi:nucleoside-diphosphate-sugar epimerase
MNILITGNLGYVGACATRRLRRTFPDGSVVGFDAGYFAHCLTAVDRSPDALLDRQYYGDVRQFPPAALANVDAIVHLAAISNDPIGNAYEDVTLDVNYRSSVALARVAKAAGVRTFVFASSCSIYGAADDRPRTEESAASPLTAYARSKVLTERALLELASPDFVVTCLRFATACGMSDRLRLDLVLNDFVACALSARRITVLSDGTPWRPLINVRDMALAIDWAVQRRVHDGGECLVVNAGSNRWNYQVRELAEAVAAAVPGTVVSINQQAPPDRRSYRVDFSKFQSLAPAHQPQAELRETIDELKRGLEAMGFCDQNFRNSSLMRLRVISDLRSGGVLNESLEWTDKHSPAVATSAV